jgi:GTPase SAR1 family protein
MSDSLVYVFVYDITSRDSFERVLECLKSMMKNKTIEDSARVLLVGNKADKANRCVDYEEVDEWGKRVGSFIEVSAFDIDK